MAYLYESWLAADEKWVESTVYLTITSTTGTRRRGVKRWLTYAEIEKQYGPVVASAIIQNKLNSQDLCESEVRFHPDAPGCEDSMFKMKLFKMGACLATLIPSAMMSLLYLPWLAINRVVWGLGFRVHGLRFHG